MQFANSTSSNLQNGQYSKFSNAFTPNNPLIDRFDYTNPNKLLHNNVDVNVLNEAVVEYRIHIDSLDRNLKKYPNPFQFSVRFNPLSDGIVSTEYFKNGKLCFTNDYFTGTPGPSISKQFKNVKYVRLESIILPQYSNYKYCPKEQKYVPDEDSFLLNQRFIQLVIDEFVDDDRLVYLTSENGKRYDIIDHKIKQIQPVRPFGIILPDTIIGRNFYAGSVFNANKIYRNSKLGNINRLSIKICDSSGNILNFDQILSVDELNECDVNIKDLRHPLNKNLQVYMTLIIGVTESQINSIPKFEK